MLKKSFGGILSLNGLKRRLAEHAVFFSFFLSCKNLNLSLSYTNGVFSFASGPIASSLNRLSFSGAGSVQHWKFFSVPEFVIYNICTQTTLLFSLPHSFFSLGYRSNAKTNVFLFWLREVNLQYVWKWMSFFFPV